MKAGLRKRTMHFSLAFAVPISQIAKREPERVVTIDARGTPDSTHAKIQAAVLEKLRLEGSSRKAQNVS